RAAGVPGHRPGPHRLRRRLGDLHARGVLCPDPRGPAGGGPDRRRRLVRRVPPRRPAAGRPRVVSFAIIVFFFVWNDLPLALTLLDRPPQPLTVGLANLQTPHLA